MATVKIQSRSLLSPKNRIEFWRNTTTGITAFLILVVIGSILANSTFLNIDNLRNIAVQASLMAVIGFGMTFVIAIAGLDLSVGSTVALTALVSAQVANNYGLVAGLLAGLFVGSLMGAVNGFIVVKWAVPSFITTLGISQIIRGSSLLEVNGGSVVVSDKGFISFGGNQFLGVPILVWTMVVVFSAAYYTLHFTPFGRHIIGVGGNENASRSAGIKTGRVIALVYVISGASAGLSGAMLSAQVGTVDGSLGMGLELNVIAIVVLGGASLAGGHAYLGNTLISAFLIASISASLNILNVPPYYQYLSTGVLLVVALSLNSLPRNRSGRRMIGASSE